MENQITRETKEIVTEMLLDKVAGIANDVLEKAKKDKQRELTVDEMVDLLYDMIITTAVLLAKLKVPVESLNKYKYGWI